MGEFEGGVCVCVWPDSCRSFRRLRTMQDTLRPVVVAGPSGVGKSTNIQRLMKEFPGRFGFSVSHTSRQPRPGEEEGKHYHFVTVEDFKKEIAANSFIEWAVYAGNYYGTSVAALRAVKERGEIALLDIDLQGVKSLKAKPKSEVDPYYLVLVPPSIEELQRRIEGRGDTSPASMRKRLDTAKLELEHANMAGFFDAVVVSGEREATYQAFRQAIEDSQKN